MVLDASRYSTTPTRAVQGRVVIAVAAIAAFAYFASILVSTLGLMANGVLLPTRYSLASNISVAAPQVIKTNTQTAIEVHVRNPDGRPVTVLLGTSFAAASTLERIIPPPTSSKIGRSGLELSFATGRDSDLHVVLEATPAHAGRMTYDLGVVIGDEISATTPMSQYVLPWR